MLSGNEAKASRTVQILPDDEAECDIIAPEIVLNGSPVDQVHSSGLNSEKWFV